MATADPRLFELITLLGDAGADWLGLEVLEGVRNGLPIEESRESLLSAQMAARFGRLPEIDKDRARSFSTPRELLGDEQLTWAVAYVVQRLTDEAEMLNASVEQLSDLTSGGQPHAESQRRRRETLAGIALQIGEDGPVLETVDIASLRSNIADLNRALGEWLETMRNRG